MKKSHLYLFYILFGSLFLCGNAHGQGTTTLRVIDMPGFPDLPLDSAYEGQSYAFDIRIINGTNTLINTALEIQLKVDSIETTIATILQPNIPAGDSLTISVTGYDFTQPQYKIGNNIVVVWPRVNGVVLPIDTLTTAVHFIPLSGLQEFLTGSQNSSLYIFPNPAKDEFMIHNAGFSRAEYVRIFSSNGAIVYENAALLLQPLNISFLKSGVYLVEVRVDGKKKVARLVVE